MAELTYGEVARRLVEQVVDHGMEQITTAAELLADAIRAGGVIQTYGTGHSRIVALEMSARAGGLAAVGMLSVKDLVMFGGADPEEILDPTYERESGLAKRIYDLAQPWPQDAFVIISNSGRNAAVVEMASLVKARGHRLVAVTSVAHTTRVARDVGSAGRLIDFADVVIDNLAPPGDATIQLAHGQRIGAVSSLTGVLIAQLLTEGIARSLERSESRVPVFISANTPEGDAHNEDLYTLYGQRIRPIEP